MQYTGDRGIEENIVAVNRNFGGHFKVQTGVSIEKFLNSLGSNDLLVHLTMYGKPIMEKIEAESLSSISVSFNCETIGDTNA